jgi:hypothetical protein
MTLTYTWKLTSIKKTNSENLNDVIIGTQWQCTGTDEDGVEGTFSGATPFKSSDVDQNNFVNYSNLTEEIVLGWIKSIVVGGYKDHIDQQILKQIRDKKNTVQEVSGKDFPWITE